MNPKLIRRPRRSGRNVCLAYIASVCPLSSSACPYTHSKSFLTTPKFSNPKHLSNMHNILGVAGPAGLSGILEAQSLLLRGPVEPQDWIPRVRNKKSTQSALGVMQTMAGLFGGPEARQKTDWLERLLETGKGKDGVPEDIRNMWDAVFGKEDRKKKRGGVGGAGNGP